MIVKTLVTANIEPIGAQTPSDQELRAAVCGAISNLLVYGVATGFEHELSQTTSITVESVTIDEREPAEFHSWVEAAKYIPSGGIWIPRIIYDRRQDGWYWRDAAADDGWNGPYPDRETAALAACDCKQLLPPGYLRLKRRNIAFGNFKAFIR